MAGKPWATVALAVVSFVGYASTAAAGPISVFTEIYQAGSPGGLGHGQDEIPVAGLGSWALLTTGGGVNPVVTVPADQTSARKAVVGFWPVMAFRDQAQYAAERGTVATVPDTPVSIYTEVWNGEYGRATQFQSVFFDAVVSASVSPEVGQNAVDWRFLESTKQVRFGDTLVSVGFEPVRQPDGVPQIQFQDGTPTIGFPGPIYYPTLLEATVDVSRPSEAPEPSSSVLLLSGLALVGLVARRPNSPAGQLGCQDPYSIR